MADVDRFRPEDRRAVEALYRRVFGHDAADASRLRWTWQYLNNPANPPEGPQIWIAREGQTVIGQYATMPVRLSVRGHEVLGSWGMDVMVAPERQRQGLGEVLFRTWDRHVGAALGLGLSDASYRLFLKMNWPDVGPVPCAIKPLTRRALRRSRWSQAVNGVVSTIALPVVQVLGRTRDGSGEARPIRRFDAAFTDLWARLAPKFDLAVVRDAAYLNWKYVALPHVRYTVHAFYREDQLIGYAVYRHAQEPRGRVTLLVDFLIDPDDIEGVRLLLGWVDHEARNADSDKIRCFATHAGFRRSMRRAGYFPVKSTVEFVVKINSLELPADFYDQTSRWHIAGDSDQDR